MSAQSPAVAALQDVLAGEHAAVYVYGVLGAQTSASGQPSLYASLTGAFAAHRDRRDALIATIGRLGATPVAADAAYQVPADLSTPGLVRATALRIERGCAATYAYAVASTTGEQRSWMTTALLDAARREIAFGGAPEALPGLGAG
jgi:hypothetical protein